MHPVQAEIIKQIIDEYMPAHPFLGITLRDVREGYACLHIGFRPELVGDPRQQRWYGGIIASMLDSAGGAAAITSLTDFEDQCSSIDLRVDFLEAGKPLDILASGEIVRSGSSLVFTKMRAWHEETGEVIAEGRAVYRVKRKGGDAMLGANIQDFQKDLAEEEQDKSGEL